MIDTNRTVGYKEPLDSTEFWYNLILSVKNVSARYVKADQQYSVLHTLTNSGEMQGDERSNIALQSTYGSIQNIMPHQAMQTGTAPSELTGRVKRPK